MKADSDADRADLRLLGQGDDRALDRLIARWERPLLAFAWRYVRNGADARDLVAGLFVGLHRRRMSLRADSNLSGWLFTALANLCHNHHRWQQRHPTVSLESATVAAGSADGLAAAGKSPDAELEHAEAMRAVGSAIDRLPHDRKVAVLLHYYEGLTFREIGGILACSERGVETRLYRARQQLRQDLAGLLAGAAKP